MKTLRKIFFGLVVLFLLFSPLEALSQDYGVDIDWIYYKEANGQEREISYDFSSGSMDQYGTIPIPASAVISAESGANFFWIQPEPENQQVNLITGAYQLSVPQATDTVRNIPQASITVDGSAADWTSVTTHIDDPLNDVMPWLGASSGADLNLLKLAFSPDDSKLYILMTLNSSADQNVWYRLFLDGDLDGYVGSPGDYQIDIQFNGTSWDVVSQGWLPGGGWYPIEENGMVIVSNQVIEASVDTSPFGLPADVLVSGRTMQNVQPFESYDLFATNYEDSEGFSAMAGDGITAGPPTDWQFAARISSFRNVSQNQYYYALEVGAGSEEDGDLEPFVEAAWFSGTYGGTQYQNALVLEVNLENGLEGAGEYFWEWNLDSGGGLLLNVPNPDTTVLDLKLTVTDNGQTLSAYYRLDSPLDLTNDSDWIALLPTPHTLPAGIGTIYGLSDDYLPVVAIDTGVVPLSETKGDLDCNGTVDLADATIALQIVIDQPPADFCLNDVNGDDRIGLIEALYALQKVAGLRSYQISYTYVQYRRYGDGSTRYQIWVEVTDEQDNQAGDVLSSFWVDDPDGQLLNLSSFGFDESTDYVALYNSGTWDEDLNGEVSRGYWGRIGTTSLDVGDYTFTAVDKSSDLLAPFVRYFSGAHPNLPVVDSSTINWSWNVDGSLTINWTLPAQALPPNLDPAEWQVDVYIAVNQGGSGTGHGYFGKVPLDLNPQHVVLSADMVSKLQSLGNELRCMVRIRKNDNSNRSYSNAVTIWEVPYIHVSIQRFFPDNYGLGISTFDSFTSYTLNGPNIASEWNSDTFIGVDLSQRPNLGDTYEIHLDYSDGTSGDRTYTVTGMNDNFAWITFPADGETINTTSPTFTWQEATGIASYHISIAEITVSGENGIWWTNLTAGTSSVIYNSDGTATADLESGKTYKIYLHTYDVSGHQATTVSTFSIAP